jgi:ubiquinone/menaquinone biosynthesis C-methylase UbiE
MHRHGNVPRAFEGRNSRIYNFVAKRLLRRVYRRLALDVAKLAPEKASILDVGTGPGVLLMELAARRPDLRLTGVDLSADMVAAATRNLAPHNERASVRVGDVTRLPFEDGSFDLIVSSLSLHHWDDPAAARPELARVLRPGGQVVIYDFGFAPIDKLAEAARTQRSPLPTGVPLFPKLTRFVLS